MTVRDIVEVVSVILNAGLFGLVLKINYQWTTLKERADILWLEYTKQHDIPFRSIGRKFEDR
jgi:hypothetical protein